MLAINNLHTRACAEQMLSGADFRNREEYWVAENGCFWLPGLFWSWEVESIGDQFLVAEAGYDRDGAPLYAVYARAEKSILFPR